MRVLFNFAQDESGATPIECGPIAGRISVVITTVVSQIGTNPNSKFTSISTALN